MKRVYLLFLLFSPFFIKAQHSEIGLGTGFSTYKGDLDPSSELLAFNKFHSSFGAFYRYNFNNSFAAKLSGNYGLISGDDERGINNSRRSRGLSFQSSIIEFGVTVEWNILGYQPYGLYQPFSPYIFAGVNGFRFEPRAELDGILYDLQPLGTEGQGLADYPDREPYALTQISFPFGMGIKYAINDTWNVGIEGGLRMTMTDYLDDVSTTYVDKSLLSEARGNIAAALSDRSENGREEGQNRGLAGQNDWYGIIHFFVSYNFMDNGLVGNRGRSGGKKGCPSNF